MDPSAYSALPRVVLDNGSGFIKIGLASTRRPPHVVPNCVGHPKRKASSTYTESHSHGSSEEPGGSAGHSHSDQSSFVSENCYTLLEYFCYRPQINSLLYDSNRQRLVWDRYIGKSNLSLVNGVVNPGNLLSINPETASICVTEPNLCPVDSRQLSAEIIFEDFGFPLACFLPSQTASAYFYETVYNKKTKIDFGLTCYPCETNTPKNADLSCCLVLDSGFGSTHSVPFANGEPIQNAALRTNSAGSVCNSYLKNITALRSVNLEFNELVVQHMKEEACYVSLDFDLELRAAKNLLKLYGSHLLSHQYILPIYTSRTKTQMLKHFLNYRKSTPPLLTEGTQKLVESLAAGKIKDQDQLNQMLTSQKEQPEEKEGEENQDLSQTPNRENNGENNYNEESHPEESPRDSDDQTVDLYSERFSVPEVLFSPQDVKMKDCGVVELIYRSIALCPRVVQPMLTRNIFVCGGSTKFPGFIRRLYKDLRPMIPQNWELKIYSSEDPSLAPFYGAKMWTNNDQTFLSNAITRNLYFENGGSVIKINELNKPKEENV